MKLSATTQAHVTHACPSHTQKQITHRTLDLPYSTRVAYSTLASSSIIATYAINKPTRRSTTGTAMPASLVFLFFLHLPPQIGNPMEHSAGKAR